MSRGFFVKLTKPYRNSHRKVLNSILLMLLTIVCFSGVFALRYVESSAIALGNNTSGVVVGTVAGKCDVYPSTHPLFIVRLYDVGSAMSTESKGYNEYVKKFKAVIPEATKDSLWLCSNKLSEWLISKNYNTDSQVRIMMKSSSTAMRMEGTDAVKNIKYLSENKTTTFNSNISNGIFMNKLVEIFTNNNRSFTAMAKDSSFLALIKSPDSNYVKYSHQLWSYITDVDAQGSDSAGWNYTVKVNERITQFMHLDDLSAIGFKYNDWNGTASKTITINKKELTAGEAINLRYLDLLLTLNAMASDKTAWNKAIIGHLNGEGGAANISITTGIVSRMSSLELENETLKPATIFASTNDICQVAYKVKAAYNLSSPTGAVTVFDTKKVTNYNEMLKTAVQLSGSKSYYSDTIYSSAIISRILSESVVGKKDGALVWGSSKNAFNMIDLLEWDVGWNVWYGVNWVLEPVPIAGSSTNVNYAANLELASNQEKAIRTLKNTNAKVEYNTKHEANLYFLYGTNPEYKTLKSIPTNDKVTLKITLSKLAMDGSSGGKANTEWDTFFKTSNADSFRMRIIIYRTYKEATYYNLYDKSLFTQTAVSGEKWSKSTDWEYFDAETLKQYLSGEKTIRMVDSSIAKLKVWENNPMINKYQVYVYLQYKNANGKWTYMNGTANTEGAKDVSIKKGTEPSEVRATNLVQMTHMWQLDDIIPPTETPDPPTTTATPTPTPIPIEYPSDTYVSKEPALAYAELKEGTIYNETFEAMSGVPSTRTLYFATGGNEFLVDLLVSYEHDTTATRTYVSHFFGTECEYKTNDQLKSLTAGQTITTTFVGDNTGKTISKPVVAEENKAAIPQGASSSNTTVKGHTSSTKFEATWTGSITNNTSEPANIGTFNAGRAGSPCAGLNFNVGTQRTKATPNTNWDVSEYNTKLQQAIAWATAMEATSSGNNYTVMKIADSDGQKRMYQVGEAVIEVTLTGGSNSYANTVQRSYSGGTYSTSTISAATLSGSDSARLGSGWGWTAGKLGVGSGYSDCGHGHNASGWHVNPVAAVPAVGTPGQPGYVAGTPAVAGVAHTHNCGTYTPGTDITQGPSSTIGFTIKVTFKNGKLLATNSDGNASDVTITTQSVTNSLPAHALCGPCCDHDLATIQDSWTQELTYDTIKIQKSNVYKIQAGYVTKMDEITYDSDPDIVASIVQGDPNIFYNIVADNNPIYDDDGKLTNGSTVGRIRYSLQEAQGDNVYYEELTNGAQKRSNKCDGLMTIKSSKNPAKLAKVGHELGFASGCLYNNGTTTKYGTASALTTETIDFESDNKATVTTVKTGYGNEIDERDLQTEEWKRFYKRRTQMVTATVISDMLILQTSSGDQSPVYYAEDTKSVQAQQDFNALTASGDVEKAATQAQVDAKWAKMWTNNSTSFAKTLADAINVGSYNGKYNLTSTKYQGTGNGTVITTRFDNDSSVFSNPKDELGLAIVKSNQSFTQPSYGTTNISSPGKAQARMSRVTNLRIYTDKIKQKPTNANGEYETGESYVFYVPILKYKCVETGNNVDASEDGQDDFSNPDAGILTETPTIEGAFEEKTDSILEAHGYKYGEGLLYKSKYSAYEDTSEYKVNNIVVHDVVSTQTGMVVKSDVEDQRTTEGIVTDAMNKLEALETCPGVPSLCEYRQLNCKYTLDTTSVSLSFEDELVDTSQSNSSGIFESVNIQSVQNDVLNTDGAHTSFDLPSTMTLINGDSTYGGFGTGQFLKVTGTGTSMKMTYTACKVYTAESSRVKVTADIYIPSTPKANTMIFSIGGVGLYIPANSNTPVFITSTGQTRSSSVSIVGRKVRISATFSLGSLYDCELAVDGTTVISQITTGLSESQIAAANVSSEMRGSGINIGCWEYDSNYATDFYLDNLTVVRRGGTLSHTASCYKTVEYDDYYPQNIYNGILNGTTSTSTKYGYTGSMQSVTLEPGTYVLETYGASGGDGVQNNQSVGSHGGLGGYSKGTLTLTDTTTLYLAVGGQGTAGSASGTGGGYNGGGHSLKSNGYGGGGGTSIFTESSVEVYTGSQLTNGSPAVVNGTSLKVVSSSNYNIFRGGNVSRTAGEYYKVEWKGSGLSNPAIVYDGGIYRLATDSDYDTVFHANEGIEIVGTRITDSVAEIYYKITKSSKVTEFRLETNGASVTVDSKTITKLNNPLIVAGGGGGADNANGAVGGSDDGSGGAGGGEAGGNAYIDGIASKVVSYYTKDSGRTDGKYLCALPSGTGTTLDSKIILLNGDRTNQSSTTAEAGWSATTYKVDVYGSNLNYAQFAIAAFNSANPAGGSSSDGWTWTSYQAPSYVSSDKTHATFYITLTDAQVKYGLEPVVRANGGTIEITCMELSPQGLGLGGTQIDGYALGVGESATRATDTGGGGSGYYGGFATNNNNGGAGGGSGYVSASLSETSTLAGINSGNGYVTITKVSSIDWTGVFDDGTSTQVTNYSSHIHRSSCLSALSEGYQIAITDAKNGDWTTLRKELGTTLFNNLVSKFNLDTSAPFESGTVVYEYKAFNKFTPLSSIGITFKNKTNGNMEIASVGDGYVWFTAAMLGADAYYGQYDTIRVNFTHTGKNINSQLFYGVDGNSYNETNSVWGVIDSLGVTFDLSSAPNWNKKNATTLRFDLAGNNFDDNFKITSIQFIKKNVSKYNAGDVLNYYYTGGVQSVTLPKGTYKLEAAGAQGGSDVEAGGLGGYATGTITLDKTTTLYLQVGGQGASYVTGTGGGYNGGGNAGTTGTSGAGGGASSIATAKGTLSEVLQNASTKSSVLLVAGGGGGGGNNPITTTSSTTTTTINDTYTGTSTYSNRNGVLAKSFIAPCSGTITYYSTSYTADPYGHVYVYDGTTGALKTQLSNDDGGDGLNFKITVSVSQGDTVSCYAGAYKSSGSCSWTIKCSGNATVTTTQSTTHYVGAGGAGGGVSGGNGGQTYDVAYNGLGGKASSYYALGQGQSRTGGDGGGGGGGYYGGFAAVADAGAGGGSGYAASQLTNVSMKNGNRSGNGYIRITVISATNNPTETDLFNYIKANMNLIPDKVTTDGVTIVNPIWECQLINNTGRTYTTETVLSCSEPHHEGSHYDYSNDICWDACDNDNNHQSTKTETIDANGNKVEQATYVTLDNFFKVHFDNTGDFYGTNEYGVLNTSINRGKGYTNNMDTTEWLREKYVKFDFDVLYERNGVWEAHTAGTWIPLEIKDTSTTKTYTLSGGTTLSIDGNTYVFDKAKGLMRCNGASTTLIEGGKIAVMNGKIFELNSDGTVNVSDPRVEYNFYCVLSNNEYSCVEVQYAVEAINYGEQSTDAAPYEGTLDFEPEFGIYAMGNKYVTNKERKATLSSYHTANKLAYIDVVGRIGNLIIEDSEDIRFSNFFKEPNGTTIDDWYIQGVISGVDSSISRNYLSWHRNSAGYPFAVDVRGEQVSGDTEYYNTWGTQEWTTVAESGSMGLSADKNDNAILQTEQLKLGYNVLFDITTIGDYNNYLQVIPYFYALNTKTGELTPVDVYIGEDGETKPINYWGLYSEYMDSNGNYTSDYYTLSNNLYQYIMYLNWTDEAERRNYTTGGLESKVTDTVRDTYVEDIYDANGDVTGYKYLTVPYGNYYNLGTMQCLQPGLRARTFVGTSNVSSIISQSARLGITNNGINGSTNTNVGNSFRSESFNHQAQRWHMTMGLPSSSVFTAYRETGVHIAPEEYCYTVSYTQGGVSQTKKFSKAYLTEVVGDKEYGIGDTFAISGVQYTIIEAFQAGNEFANSDDYIILMTADIKAIGDVWNLKYSTGNDNGYISIDGVTYHFDSSIPTFIAAYDAGTSLLTDIATQQTH